MYRGLVTFIFFALSIVSATFDAPSTVMPSVVPELFVSVDGSESDFCGTTANPCTFSKALLMAPPHSVLRVRAGRYYGEYRITKPLFVVGEEAGVIFDGEFESRPMWFDNVPARLEHMSFVNGFGEGSGCVLVTMASDNQDDGNTIAECEFVNCTGIDSANLPVVAGGLLIYYAYSSGRQYEIIRSKFHSNYARGSDAAVGAILVQYGNDMRHHKSPIESTHTHSTAPIIPSAAEPHPVRLMPCEDVGNKFRIGGAQETSECVKWVLISGSTVRKLGSIFTRWPNVSINGQPVFATVPEPPKDSGVKNNYLAYCDNTGSTVWTIDAIESPITQITPCRAHTSMINQPYPCPRPDSCSHWSRLGVPILELVRFQCQDFADLCPLFTLSNIPPAQEARAGAFGKAELVRAMRPTFVRTDESAKDQFVWYCEGAEEWIVTDDDPRTWPSTPTTQCSRGLASGVATDLHPASIVSWRYFDKDWKAAPQKSPVTIKCAQQGPELCDAIDVVNANFLDGIPMGPFLLTNFTWRSRPTYYSLASSYWVWFCQPFAEWIVSLLDPATLDPREEEKCMREVSSHATSSFSPLTPMKWAHLQGMDWVTVNIGTGMRCVSDCSAFGLEVDGLVGIYETVSMYKGARVFRQTTPPYHYLWREEHFWFVLTQFEPGLDADSLVTRASMVGLAPVTSTGSEPIKHPFWAREWRLRNRSTNSLDPIETPVMRCTSHARCSTINVTMLPRNLRALNGVYLRRNYLKGGRPVFTKSKAVANCEQLGEFCDLIELFYCPYSMRWVIGPASENTEALFSRHSSCFAWAASATSAAWSPTEVSSFNYVLKAGSRSDEFLILSEGIRVVCATIVEAPPPVHSAPPVSSISNCTFTANTALGEMNSSAGGGLVVYFASGTVGDGHVGTFRKLTIESNDASSTHLVSAAASSTAVGGFAIFNHLLHLHRHYMHNLVINDNAAAVGGMLLRSVSSTGSRITIARNKGSHNGGGLHVFGWANISFSRFTCTRNYAGMHGGCVFVDPRAAVHFSKSEFSDNVATSGEGSLLHGGVATIMESKLLGLTSKGITTTYLSLTNSEIQCGPAKAVTYTHGFGCVEEEFPSVSLLRLEAVGATAGGARSSDSSRGMTFKEIMYPLLRIVVGLASILYLGFYFYGWLGIEAAARRRPPTRR